MRSDAFNPEFASIQNRQDHKAYTAFCEGFLRTGHSTFLPIITIPTRSRVHIPGIQDRPVCWGLSNPHSQKKFNLQGTDRWLGFLRPRSDLLENKQKPVKVTWPDTLASPAPVMLSVSVS